MTTPTCDGRSAPVGATVGQNGVNFSVYSRDATRVDLLLFDHADDQRPTAVIPTNRTYHYWHVMVPGLQAGQLYGYRATGPFHPAAGLRFDSSKVLLDPYGRGVAVPDGYAREPASTYATDTTHTAMKSVVIDSGVYDWEGDAPLQTPSSRTIVYEMHVRGFTRHPNSGVSDASRGTFRGVIEKIPYLRELGISAVELLPVFQFDPYDAPNKVNYWGYAPVSFFAPHQAYSSRKDPIGPVDEFRDLVKALHRAGIEVILDVVYNHTAEDNHTGPTVCFRGLANSIYYTLEADQSRYANFTGTGNTLNANHPIVRRLIVDSLRYWVEEMHVDGFRFDLASILARAPDGTVLANPPVLWDIESDPVLAGTKIIAEAWDAAGLYQVGTFIGDSWKEWNGRFRDDVRSFFRGDGGSLRRFADRLLGSPEVYAHEQREAEQSVNFVACHDGFTLNDIVSYVQKHNEANGEQNRDGSDDNRSWNCGVEGPTDDPTIDRVRNQQVKNMLAVTTLALGLPMVLMGDEVRRTQLGNNNAYCQDNETSWFDWSLVEKHADILRFVRLLTARRALRDASPDREHMLLTEVIRSGNTSWHGVRLNQPDWNDYSHSVALHAEVASANVAVFFIFSAYWEPLDFELPAGQWKRWIDTARESPDDIVPWTDAPAVSDHTYPVGPRSVVVLWSRTGPK